MKNELKSGGSWADDDSLNSSIPDKVIVHQLQQQIERLRAERGVLKTRIANLESVLRSKNKLIEGFKKWREHFLSMNRVEQIREASEIMQGNSEELKMLKLLSLFFTTNTAYQSAVRALKNKYGSMIATEASMRISHLSE